MIVLINPESRELTVYRSRRLSWHTGSYLYISPGAFRLLPLSVYIQYTSSEFKIDDENIISFDENSFPRHFYYRRKICWVWIFDIWKTFKHTNFYKIIQTCFSKLFWTFFSICFEFLNKSRFFTKKKEKKKIIKLF